MAVYRVAYIYEIAWRVACNIGCHDSIVGYHTFSQSLQKHPTGNQGKVAEEPYSLWAELTGAVGLLIGSSSKHLVQDISSTPKTVALG